MERKKRVEEIKRLIQEKRKEPSHALFRFLTSKGIAKSIAEEIASEFILHHEELPSLQQIVAKKVRTIKNPEALSSKKIAFIGAPGVGKTTLILKLAEHYSRQNKRIAILTLEPEKIRAQILKCHLHSLAEIPVFEKWHSFQTFEMVLIDTPGCNFYDESAIDLLGELLSCCQEIEIVLTLSSTAKEEDLFAAVHQFSSLRPSGLSFTKLDETLTSGNLINILAKTELAIYFVSYGSFLNGGVQVADPIKITHKILTDLNGEKFQFLRRMALVE